MRARAGESRTTTALLQTRYRQPWCAVRSPPVARLAILPLQDLLGLDSRARMNTPATITGNGGRGRSPGTRLPPQFSHRVAAL